MNAERWWDQGQYPAYQNQPNQESGWYLPPDLINIEGQLHDGLVTRFYQPDDRGDVLARAVNLHLEKGKSS